MRRLSNTGVLVLLALCAAAPAAATPVVLPGWPVPAPAGPVLAGRDGGVVVSGTAGLDTPSWKVVAAFTADGSRRWVAARRPGCGNCDGEQPTRLHPDGGYGPVGFTADDFWNVDAAGRIVAGCPGVAMPGGDCIAAGGTPATTPLFSRTRAGVARWALADGDAVWTAENEVWAPVVIDGEGVVYTAFPPGPAPGDRRSGRGVALDAATGALRWRTSGVDRVVTALDRGVLANTPDGVAALGEGAIVRWTLPPSLGPATFAITDAARGEVVVQMGTGVPRVAAVGLATGEVRWITGGGRAARLLSTGPRGMRYLTVGRTLRAVTVAGRVAWTLPAAQPIAGAHELGDGTVMVSTGGGEDGLLLRVAPRRTAPRVTKPAVDLSRRVIRPCGTARGCVLEPASGAVLRVRMPRSSTLRLRLVLPGGGPGGVILPRSPVAVPAGESHLRFDAGAARARRATLEVRWRLAGRPGVARIPLRLVR